MERIFVVATWVVALGAGLVVLVHRRPPTGQAPPPEAPPPIVAREVIERPPPIPEEARPDAPPATYRGGPRRTGRAHAAGPLMGREAFRLDLGGRIVAQVVFDEDGDAYIGTLSGVFYRVSPSGEIRWQRELGGAIWSTALVRGGRVIVGVDGGAVVGLARGDGAERFRFPTEGDADVAIAGGQNGRIYAAEGPRLHALARNGRPLWTFEAGAKIFSAPAIAPDRTVVFGSQDDHLYGLNPDGTERFKVPMRGDVDAGPAIAPDGTIFVGGDDRRVRAISPEGRVRFTAEVGGMVRTGVALGAAETLWVPTLGPSPALLGLSIRDGRELYRYAVTPVESRALGVQSAPMVDARGDVYFGAHDGFVHIVSGRGQALGRIEVGTDVDAPLALDAEGALWFGDDAGGLRRIVPVP